MVLARWLTGKGAHCQTKWPLGPILLKERIDSHKLFSGIHMGAVASVQTLTQMNE